MEYKDLPNIYTILETIDFETKAKNIQESFYRFKTIGLNDEALEFNRNQVVFSVIQEFYEQVMIDLENKGILKI